MAKVEASVVERLFFIIFYLKKYCYYFLVALQFPEGLLMFACTIADIIEK